VIIYQSIKDQFLNDVLSNNIEQVILEQLNAKTGKTVGEAEIRSWRESMRFMGGLLNDQEIPSNCGVTIEYHIPQTSKRIDFILTGQGEEQEEYAILIELKQWAEAGMTTKDGVVITRFKNGSSEVSHPSYQAWSYAALLQGFNSTVEDDNIQLKPCAYLHNYSRDNVITNEFYGDYIKKAPLFLKGPEEQEKLRDFIKQFVRYGDTTKIMYRIDNGKIRPSKNIADSIVKMIQGNQEFIMIDDQKIVYETAMQLAKASTLTERNVLIVEGGPGTGKSVVALNLLAAITKLGLLAKYVSKNAAPRGVYESKLTGTLRKTEISNLFSGSGAFVDAQDGIFDALVVDEAHRLTEKSGLFNNLGVNQIKEIINASKCSIFFLDEDQKVTFKDIGNKEQIQMWAWGRGAEVHEMTLSSQFRCGGSNGYLAWLDDVLQIRDTANDTLDDIDYDFQIVSDPNTLRDLIVEKNKINNKARLVAGYCWDWISKKSPNLYDINIPEHGFLMRWNLATDGNLWIMSPSSVTEAGCIHTCQGLEVDYVGVIVGPDLVVRNGQVITDGRKRAKTDKSIAGFKSLLKSNPEAAKSRADEIIKNTYRTLMTRGIKGCSVYFTDKETEEYFRRKL
jgi:uncharacterized protein